jgi:hypothetical protein
VQFINPLFLIGLGAALLPVLYHLIRRMQAKKVPFGSLMFLTATPKQIVRKRRLKDILLMMIRAAMFALLAMAFARPFLAEEQLPFQSTQQDRSVVFVVDNSYSMQYGDLFEQAKQEVLRRIDEGGANDEFAIIAFSNQARQLTDLTTDRSLLRGAVQTALQVSNRPTDFYRPLRIAEEVLQGARHPNRSIVLISDMQRSGWSGALDNWKLAPGIEFVPVQVADGATGNAYVEAVEMTQQRSGNVVGIRLETRIAAMGEYATRPNTVSMSLDGQAVDRRSIEPLPSNRITFQQQTDRSGNMQGELALAEDGLAVDDRYYFTYAVAGRPSILAIDGTSSGTSRDAFFLGSAFNLGDEGLYSFSAGTPQRLTRSELLTQGMVFVANVPGLGAAQLDALKEYVERGGGLILSFGQRSEMAGYSSVLNELGIGRIEGNAPRDVSSTPAIIGEVDLRHPMFNVFAGSGSTVILRPTFRRYVEIVPDSGATVIGRYDTGAPFLIERQLGLGRVIVYTSTLNTDWTDFPLQEMYVPFVYQLAKYASSSSGDRRMFAVGETVPLRGRPGDLWEVRAPGDRLYRVTANDAGEGFFQETEAPGHYIAESAGNRFYFSVNVDPLESNLDVRDVEETYAAVVDPNGTREAVAQTTAAVNGPDAESNQKLWKYIILAVIVLFALESFLANRPAPAFTRKPVQAPVSTRHQQPV